MLPSETIQESLENIDDVMAQYPRAMKLAIK